jgi:hypothetical protein
LISAETASSTSEPPIACPFDEAAITHWHQVEPANLIAQFAHNPVCDFGAHSGHSIDPFDVLMRDRSNQILG